MKKQVPFLSFITGLGSIIGSGWLFGAANATRIAGPLAPRAWVIGAGMILCIPDIYANSQRDHRRQRAAELLARLGLEGREHHKLGELSGGQQQRVSIAHALTNGGEIILADAPTGALDSQSGREVLAILCELNRRGHTVVMVTHDMDVAWHAQRIIELRDGEIISDSGRHIPGTESLPLPAVIRPRRQLYL